MVGNVDPGVDMKTPPKIQVDTMLAGRFLAYAAEILKKSDALTGKWNSPPVMKAAAPTLLPAQ